jgi:hypothetical protein
VEVVNTRMLSVKHIMVGDRKTSNDSYMVNIIWNIERISLDCCFAADIGESLERNLISLLTRRKSSIVLDNITFSGWCGWCGAIRRAEKDTINVKGWPYADIPQSI